MAEQKWEEATSAWFKFVKVGDEISGTLINKRFSKSRDGKYPDQWIYEIRKEDGSIVNTGISVFKSGTIQRLNNIQMGTFVKILFEKEGPSAIKGGAKAHYLKVMVGGMDQTYTIAKEFNGEEISVENVEM